jgi:hypothetical protein
MTTEEFIANIRALLDQYEAEQAPPPPAYVTVQPGEDLAAAFATGLPVHLVAGQTYPGITLPSGARLVGNGAWIHGVGRRALYAAPRSTDIQASDVICTADQDSVVQLGDNSAITQGTVADVPSAITLSRVSIPTHRGKRGFEVHARNVALLDCSALDVYYPGVPGGGVDSQGLWVFNTPGEVYVKGGHYQGGSESFMTAGDDIKLADCPTISDLLFEDVLFDRSPEWRGDTSVYRQVKNICELKNANDVICRRCTFRENWTEGQSGYALMLTPTRGGRVVNVLFEDCVVENAAGFMNVTALDSAGLCTVRTTGLRWVRGRVNVNRAVYGKDGTPSRPILLTGPVGTLDIEDTSITHDGTSFVYASGGMTDRIRVVGSTFPAGAYGFNIAGGANASLWSSGCQDLTVTGNTISGAASALKTNLAAIGKTPANSYV